MIACGMHLCSELLRCVESILAGDAQWSEAPKPASAQKIEAPGTWMSTPTMCQRQGWLWTANHWVCEACRPSTLAAFSPQTKLESLHSPE